MQTEKKQTLAVSAGVHATQDGLTSTVYVLLPILAQSLSLGYAQVGIVRAVYSGIMWVFEIPAGILAERFGERRLLVFGLMTAGLGYGILSTANTVYGVLFALLIAGTGAAFQHSLSSSLISRVFDGTRRRVALGTYNASGDAGKLLFTGVASLLFGVGIAWQVVVGGYGILALLASVGLWLVLRRRFKGAESVQPGDSATTAGWGITDRSGFRWLAAIVFFDIAVQDGFLVFVAFLMVEKNMPAGLAAFAVVATLAGGVIGKYICGHLSARFGVVRSVVLVEACTAAGIVGVILLPPVAAFVLLPVVGVVLQGSSTITYGSVSQFVDETRQSRGFAVIYSMANAASVAGPVGFGMISDFFSVGAAVGIMAIVTLLPLGMCGRLQAGLNRVATKGRP
ncbi:MAG: MFS transporter [Fuerstiella sp.]|nr:MFS transporter [Fuerstiella sp.]